MNPKRLRLWLAILIFLIALVLLTASMLPLLRYQQVIPMPPVVLPEPVSLFLMLKAG
jgi:hypothetical protein